MKKYLVMSFFMVFSLTLVGMGDDETEPLLENKTVESEIEVQLQELKIENKKKKEEKIAFYIGNNDAAQTFKKILNCNGVEKFKKMVDAFDGETSVEFCCCWPISKRIIKAESINAKTKPTTDLFKIIEKIGTLSLYKSQPFSLMGNVFLLEVNDSDNLFKEHISDLESNELINWVKTEKEAKDLLTGLENYQWNSNNSDEEEGKLRCKLEKCSQFLTSAGVIYTTDAITFQYGELQK